MRPAAGNSDPLPLPSALGYRMPAEWDPHAATWLAWPHNRSDWPGKFEPIPWIYAEVVRHLAVAERVEILVDDARSERQARALLAASHTPLAGVRFHRIPTNRSWTRDFAPIFLRMDGVLLRDRQVAAELGTDAVPARDRIALTKWRFNGWAKYSDWRKDDSAGSRIARGLAFRSWSPAAVLRGRRQPVVLEGGAIDVNGQGTLLATEECLLSPRRQRRNPGLSREQMEVFFADYLGVRHVVWLEAGIVGDDTHGHIDDIARFVSPDTVVAVVERDPRDPNFAPLRSNLARLRAATDQHGRPLRVIELPMPAPVFFRGQRLPASYANFYLANGLVLLPTFGDPNDIVALDTLAELFPDRRIVPIYCRDLVLGLGTLHCMTQQQPAG